VHFSQILSEIGIYAWTLSDDERILERGIGDHLVRSKKYGTNEGGICTGFAFLDTYTTV